MKRKIFFALFLLFILLLSCTGYVWYRVEKHKLLAFNGISINDHDVSNYTADEIEDKIQNDIIPEINDKEICFTYNDKEYRYKLNNYEGKFKSEEAIHEALDYGKEENYVYQCMSTIIDNDKNIELKYEYTDESLKRLIQDIKKDIDEKPIDATLTKCNNNFQIKEEKNGIAVNEEDLLYKINNNLCYNLDEKIEINTKELLPDIKADDLKKIKGIIGSFQTNYSSSSYARRTNIEIVTKNINGTILMPGEVFSYGAFAKKGIGKYMYAPGYVSGKVVNVEGGGICQPCTTLYRAIMSANIRSIERHPHMYTVSYSRPGLDATVGNWGDLDYKFKNTYDFPIYIEGIAQGGIVRFNIYGDLSVLDGYTYDMVSEVYGLSANSYLLTYDRSGKLVKRELISNDTYLSH